MYGRKRRRKMLDLDKAREELKNKSYGQLQTDTAWAWGSRACVSYENSIAVTGQEKLVFWSVAEELFHEALEHAALGIDGDMIVKAVRDAVYPYQEKAAASMISGEVKNEGPKDNI
jgi:hypothetical protein